MVMMIGSTPLYNDGDLWDFWGALKDCWLDLSALEDGRQPPAGEQEPPGVAGLPWWVITDQLETSHDHWGAMTTPATMMAMVVTMMTWYPGAHSPHRRPE